MHRHLIHGGMQRDVLGVDLAFRFWPWWFFRLGCLLWCLVVSPGYTGEVCAVLTPRSLFIFSCGNFEARFWCRHWIVGADVCFSVSLVGDEIYVGENAHDLFTVLAHTRTSLFTRADLTAGCA